MATRPSITVNVRASDAVYTTGVAALVGKATKISRSGADIAEGYKVDSPLGSQPVTAQEVNFEHNRNDQWVEWVSLGSAAAGGNTHIVETDSGGDINVLGVNCIDVRVFPNIGTDGIEVTTTGGSKGIEIIQEATSTDFGVAVIAAVGAVAPGMYSETRTGVGLQLTHGSSAGLNTTSVVESGVIGPGIKLGSNTLDPTDDAVGTMWTRTENSIDNVKMGMGASAGYPIITKNAPCYARSTGGGFVLSGSQTDQTVRANFSFKTDQIPQDSDQVRVTIWGNISMAPAQDNIVTLKVRDKTVGGNPTICELPIQFFGVTGETLSNRQSATFSETYTLPASGSRTFDLVWSGNVTGVDAFFTGFVEIEQLRG